MTDSSPDTNANPAYRERPEPIVEPAPTPNPHTDYPLPGPSSTENPRAQGVNNFFKLQLRIFPLVAILALIFSVVIIYFAITAR